MEKNNKKTKKQTTITSLPVLATRYLVVFPGTRVVVDVAREMSLNAIHCSEKEFENEIIVVPQTNQTIDNPEPKDLYKVGTKCYIEGIESIGDGEVRLNLFAIDRVKLLNTHIEREMFLSNYEVFEDEKPLTEANKEVLIDIYKAIKKELKNPESIKEFSFNTKVIDEIFKKDNLDGRAVDFICSLFYTAKYQDLQILNEEGDPNKRIEKYILLSTPTSFSNKINSNITKIINDNLSKQQKEFYLREKLRVIKEELGDISTRGDDADSMRERVRNNPYPEYIKKRLLSEISKMETASNSNESYITKSFIELLLDLPWWQQTEDTKDLEKVTKILDKNHYGLEKVKEAIIENLAIAMRTKEATGTIICLVGPPGVGKTSLAKSIAEALNKKFAKVSLGGMKDEAEIKGHRKTYVGAMPGRIIKEMKKVGVNNPLFLLDEIDKLSSDHRGDPASTLLDILDKEQNKYFSDNYVEEEFDLSNTLFIATANYEENIPEALRDRLEIIRLDSYTENEKLSIAEKYLVPKALKEANLSNKELTFTKEGLEYIIKRYTREAGVREVERCIKKIARKFVVALGKKQIEKDVIDIDRVKYYLKKEIFEYTKKDDQAIPGIVNGMAYTSAGGDLLPIEVATCKGKGKINVTGNLKETMKESVSVALGYVKVNAEKYGINTDFAETDFHIHVPSGGIPKDGPSAGVTLTTAIISALKQKAVPTTISMTGEITLRGKVLIIGGVKEKVISAVRGGVNEIFIPADDERYLDDVPKDILKKTRIHLVNNYDDIYNRLFKK